MLKLEEIKETIQSLPENEYDQFRRWFSEIDWQKWDEEIEEDSDSGKLDSLFDEALHEKRIGSLKDL
ncbi:MAG: hypothetical protein V1897_11365 [Pseudomonadota bacterium]